MTPAFILPSPGLPSVTSSSFLSRHALPAIKPSTAPTTTTTMLFGKGGIRGRRVRGPGGMGGGGGGGVGGGAGGGAGGGRGPRGAGGGRAGTGGGSGFMSSDSNPFKAVHAAYLAQIRKNAVVTKMITSFIGFAAATALVHGGGELDWNEVIRNGLLGAVVHGLGGHYYYGASERALPGQVPGNVIAKTAIDFFLAVPLVSVSFGVVKTILDDKGLGDVVDHVVSSWKIPAPIWAMWSCLNMYVAPVDERVLFYNAVIVFSAVAKKLSDKPTAPSKSK